MNASPLSPQECAGNFIAPLLTQDIIEFFHQRQLTPIVIYPEVFDNPLNAPFFGRYILNYPGKASLHAYSAVEDLAFAYSKVLAKHCTARFSDRAAVDDVLFIPTMDLGFWKRQGQAPIRQGTCFYAGKMRRVHGVAPENTPVGSVELHNSVDMNQADIRRYFWRSEAFYCYEDSALAIEAQLCGCPTVFVPNSLFDGTPLASKELGPDGSCVLGEVGGLKRARDTVGQVEAIVREHMANVPERIAELSKKWRAKAAAQDYRGTIDYPFEPRLVFIPKLGASANTHLDVSSTRPVVTLDHHTMRDIAREVWYEKNRHGLVYNIIKYIKSLTRSKEATTSPSTHLKAPLSTARRIVLFAHFDRDGIIDDYVIYYLRSLAKVSNRILFMSDCELRDGEGEKLRGIAELVFAAHHEEYDFGSWKRGFAFLNYDVTEWDELIIANDSCYAPTFSFEQTFGLIGECDFWGATKEPYSRLSADIAARRAERTCMQKWNDRDADYSSQDFDFLNSYFMVFRSKILRDPTFLDFWRKVEKQDDKERVIEVYEIGLTRLLLSRGYGFSCFAVRAGTILYERFEIDVPDGFQLPWLRVLIFKENKELISELDKKLNQINYPRFLIDAHIERMTGTACPSHYHIPAKLSALEKFKSRLPGGPVRSLKPGNNDGTQP